MLVTMPNSHELEVIPGHRIYTNEVQGAPQGVYLRWEHLSDDQRTKFLAVHAELAQVATRLQGLFITEFAGREDTVLGY